MSEPVVARAPGRVNLIGDHTDYAGGLVLPMAIDLATTVTGTRRGSRVQLSSAQEQGDVDIDVRVGDPTVVTPRWGRYVAGVVASLRPRTGLTGTVSSTIPVGAGLSSSAALEVAVALALGFDGSPLELARRCQHAEHVATGVPCGIMDQLASTSGVAGHALLIDCTSLDVTPVAVPEGLEVVVVDSGESRQLATTPYAERRRDVERAAALVGPLRDAAPDDVAGITDDRLRRRARHVVTENARVLAFASALRSGRLDLLGELVRASHASLRDDFGVSTPTLDALIARCERIPGVIGARLTGAGFGGCVVVLAHTGADVDGWRVTPAAGARVESGAS